MTLPLWCTGRPLGTWRGTSSSAGTSRRCAVGFSWISPHKEREAWKRRNLEGWQEGHAVATTVPFICRCVPGCHGTWADGQRKKKMSLNFCTRQFRAQRDRCYYQGGDFSPFNIVDAQRWPGLSVTWKLLQESCFTQRARTSRPFGPGMALGSCWSRLLRSASEQNVQYEKM